jgi:hypothetical protein
MPIQDPKENGHSFVANQWTQYFVEQFKSLDEIDFDLKPILDPEDGEILMAGSHIKVTSSNSNNLIGFELNIYDYDGIEWIDYIWIFKKSMYDLKVYPQFLPKWEGRTFNKKNVELLKEVLDIPLMNGWYEIDFFTTYGDKLGLGIAFHFGNRTQSSLVQKNSCRSRLIKMKNIRWSRKNIRPLIAK